MNKRLLIASLMIFLVAGYVRFGSFQTEVPLKKSLAELPLSWGGWEGREMFFSDIILEKLNVSDYTMRTYKKGTSSVNLYIGYYNVQKKNAQIHSPKHCLPGSGWLNLSERKRKLHVEGMGEVGFVESVYQKNSRKVVFYYWYQMKDLFITNEYALKLHMILNSLRYGRNDAAFLRISSPMLESLEHSGAEIEEFMVDFLPLLGEFLPN